MNEELIGTMDEIETSLGFAMESLDSSDDATVKASKEAVEAYIAKMRNMLAELENGLVRE